MNNSVNNSTLEEKIFQLSETDFLETALEIFRFQHQYNPVYRQYCDLLGNQPAQIQSLQQIPFLPISFFKSHSVTTTAFEPAAIFESSGTTQTINSRHLVKSMELYRQSFTKGFELFYGEPKNWCILALLPAYLERSNSSLVVMANELIQLSQHPNSGFYLNNLAELHQTLQQLEAQQQPTLLIGVTFALLDFSEQFPLQLNNTTIMETGGMKGRRKEMTRAAVHDQLCKAFGITNIHSEYGMTELLSQGYSKGQGIFDCPPWMKILTRDDDDPFTIHAGTGANGALNVIDLANLYSCSFIATEDAGRTFNNGSFEVLGRLDNSDIRGCSLMAL